MILASSYNSIEDEDARGDQARGLADRAHQRDLAASDEQCAAWSERMQQTLDDTRARLFAEVNQHIFASDDLVLPRRQAVHHVARHEAHLGTQARSDAER